MTNKTIKNVLLINPPTGKYLRGEDRCQVPVEDLTATVSRMPLDLAYIAGSLVKEGITVNIKDYPAEDKSISDFYFDLVNLKPDLLLVSTTMFTLFPDLYFLRLAKSNFSNLTTVIKGVSANYWKEKILSSNPEVDIILSGEYELTLPLICRNENLHQIPGVSFRKDNKVILSKCDPIIYNLDSLPFPARNLLNNKLYIRPDTNEPITTIQTSRGCPYQCIYCLAPVVSGNKTRFRTPANIVDEIEECVKTHNIKNFFFRADTFTLNKNWVREISSELKKRHLKIGFAANSRVDSIDEELIQILKESGCFLISLGIESGSEKSLKLMKKGTTLKQCIEAVKLLKKYNLKTYLFFMIGFPWENKKDIEETINFSLTLDGDFSEFHIPVPFENTQLRKIMTEEGLLIENDFLSSSSSISSHGFPVIGTKYLSAKELLKLRKSAITKYYLRPKYIFRTLSKTRSIKEFLNYLKYGFRRVFLLLFR